MLAKTVTAFAIAFAVGAFWFYQNTSTPSVPAPQPIVPPAVAKVPEPQAPPPPEEPYRIPDEVLTARNEYGVQHKILTGVLKEIETENANWDRLDKNASVERQHREDEKDRAEFWATQLGMVNDSEDVDKIKVRTSHIKEQVKILRAHVKQQHARNKQLAAALKNISDSEESTRTFKADSERALRRFREEHGLPPK